MVLIFRKGSGIDARENVLIFSIPKQKNQKLEKLLI